MQPSLYIKAVQDVERFLVVRLRNPLMMFDWIFRLSKQGKTFFSGLEVLHSHAEQVCLTKKNTNNVKNIQYIQVLKWQNCV